MEIGGAEAMIVLLVLLALFGPGRVSGLARSLGEGIREYRTALREGAGDDDSD